MFWRNSGNGLYVYDRQSGAGLSSIKDCSLERDRARGGWRYIYIGTDNGWCASENRSCTHEKHNPVCPDFTVDFDDAVCRCGRAYSRDKQQPDAAILSLEEMEITVRIDNGDARVFVRQVFANHTGGIEEGNYIFALPSHATISDFATWDGQRAFPL